MANLKHTQGPIRDRRREFAERPPRRIQTPHGKRIDPRTGLYASQFGLLLTSDGYLPVVPDEARRRRIDTYRLRASLRLPLFGEAAA